MGKSFFHKENTPCGVFDVLRQCHQRTSTSNKWINITLHRNLTNVNIIIKESMFSHIPQFHWQLWPLQLVLNSVNPNCSPFGINSLGGFV
jgi:hypothetical protein